MPARDGFDVAIKAFRSCFQMFSAYRSLGIPFYAGIARLLAGLIALSVLAYLCWLPLLCFKFAFRSNSGAAFVEFWILMFAIYGWYVSALATSTVIVVSTAHWRGTHLNIRDTRNALKTHFATLWDSVSDTIHFFLIGLIGIAPFIIVTILYTPFNEQERIRWYFTFFISLTSSVIPAYMVLALRGITLGAVRPKRALFYAHQEILRHCSAYTCVMLGLFVVNIALSSARSLYATHLPHHLNPTSYFNNHILSLHFPFFTFMGSYLWLLQTLPFIWIAEQQLTSTQRQKESLFISRILMKVGISSEQMPRSRFISLSLLATVIALLTLPYALRSIAFYIITHKSGPNLTMNKLPSLADIQKNYSPPMLALEALGFHVPHNYVVDRVHIALRNVGFVRQPLNLSIFFKAISFRLHRADMDAGSFSITITTRLSPSLNAHPLEQTPFPEQCSEHETRPHTQLLSKHDERIPHGRHPIIIHECLYQVEHHTSEMEASATEFMANKAIYNLNAQGSSKFYNHNVIRAVVQQLVDANASSL